MLTVSLIGFREYAASRRFLHEIRVAIRGWSVSGAVDIYPNATCEQGEGFEDSGAVMAALAKPADLVIVSGHCAFDRVNGSDQKWWWIGGRTHGREDDSSWYFYVKELGKQLPSGQIGATGGVILDCCDGGNPDFFQDLAPYLKPSVPCLGVDGEAAPRGTRTLNLKVIQSLFDTAAPDLSAAHVTATMNTVADEISRRRRRNFPRVHWVGQRR